MFILKNFFRSFRVVLPCFWLLQSQTYICSFERMVGSQPESITGMSPASGHYHHFRFMALLIVEAFDGGAVDTNHYLHWCCYADE